MKVDKRNFKKFKKALTELGKIKIQIGAVGDHANSDLTNAELLIIHEFGAPEVNIPARSPIRTTIRNKSNLKILSKNIQDLIAENYNQQKHELNQDNVAIGIGETLVLLVQASIKRRLTPRNEDSTLAKKRGTLPLFDTGQLFNSIEYGVVK